MTNEPLETAAALGASFGEGQSAVAARPAPSPSRERSGHLEAWSARAATIWERIEARLLWLSDWLNPILVKETRQALKSWQFVLTFVLLLVACWIVTIGGVSLIGPSIYYAAGGGEMLLAYYFILALPLLVVVPFAAFRSLAAERDDNTYDLLSITTLRPRQIISGKLGSSVVQMAVFFSAITPCLAFTYLLRGVDVPTIVALLAYTFFASLGLSMIGLLLATLSRQRYGQLVLSVAFIAMLLGALSLAITFSTEIVQGGISFDDPEVWIVHFAFATFYVTTFALVYLAAAGMITFATDNRSTPLRIGMLVQQACWIGWMGYAWISSGYQPIAMFIMSIFAGCYWYIAGTMLTSERPELSHRVRRRLPTSTLGRALFGWLNPGPVSGYMFVVANLTSVLVVGLIGSMFSNWAGRGPVIGAGTADLFCYLLIGWGYVVAYLGLGLLVITLLRRVAVVSMLGCVLVQVLLVMAGSGIPVCIQLMSVVLRDRDYSYLQVTNPIWTMHHLSDMGRSMAEMEKLVFVLPAAAACVLVVNFPALVREVRRVRVALPARVAIDEAELHPEPAAGPTSPWDVADATS